MGHQGAKMGDQGADGWQLSLFFYIFSLKLIAN